MNKTIEFIDEKIKNQKNLLKRLEKPETISNKYELQINESLKKNAEENLEYFKQIKCELEAWEVVASILIEHKLVDLSWLLKNDFEKAQKIIKALGVV